MGVLSRPIELRACGICNRAKARDGNICRKCQPIDFAAFDDLLFLVVDASFADGRGGAGLVLVRCSLTSGDVVAFRRCSFFVRVSMDMLVEG